MKLPLKVSDSHGLCIVDFERKMVAEGNIDEDMKHEAWSADADDFNTIVHYVNTHDALVAALTAIRPGFCEFFCLRITSGPEHHTVIHHSARCEAATDALKLAEGK